MRKKERFVIEPQTGKGFKIEKGNYFRIIDVEGQQVADMWAIVENKSEMDWLSTSQTRDINERLFPNVGEHFYSDQGAKLLTFVENNSPCRHDMLFPACNNILYEKAGFKNHPNCRDNFTNALNDASISLPFVPDPVNIFQSSNPQENGNLEVLASENPKGGNTLFYTHEDLFIVITACSVDYHPTNGDKCTSIEIELYY